MPHRTVLHKIVLGLVIFAGLVPLVYFVSVETGLSIAVAEETIPDEATVTGAIDRYVENPSRTFVYSESLRTHVLALF